MNLKQRDRKFLARGDDAEDIQVGRTEGSYIVDVRGKRYIDFLAGWCVGNFGWGRRRVRKPPVDYTYPEYLYAPWVDLAELLAELTPGNLQKSFRATGGSEAVDIALQIAMASTGRRRFISIEGAYHGNAIGGVSVGSSEERETYPNLLAGCVKLKPPLNARAAERLERLLKRRDVAALILEPISLNLGVLVPEDDFVQRAAALCRRYGTLFIADEVATGFGRTGKLFACEHFDVVPDILCLAKAMSGGSAPIGATITTAKIANSLNGAAFYSTYGWHPYSVEAALAHLRWLNANAKKVLRNVEELSRYFRHRLNDMCPSSEVRVHGLAIAVEMEDEDQASKVMEKCRRNGLLLTTGGTCLTMFPALTMQLRTAEEGLNILERTLTSARA